LSILRAEADAAEGAGAGGGGAAVNADFATEADPPTAVGVGWIVGGPRGAAAKLGLRRTTLLAKMRRLGISRPIRQEETGVLALAPAAV